MLTNIIAVPNDLKQQKPGVHTNKQLEMATDLGWTLRATRVLVAVNGFAGRLLGRGRRRPSAPVDEPALPLAA